MSMTYAYGLVVKGNATETASEVTRRLSALAVSVTLASNEVQTAAGAESYYTVSAERDLTVALNTWFMEDFDAGRVDGPFPVGSLMYWHERY